MELSTEQAAQFRTQGFVTAEGFFDPTETAAMRSEVERFKRAGLLRNVVPGEDSARAANLQLCPMYKHSPLFRALPFADKVVRAVTRLIGEPALLHLDQVFVKPGRHGSGTSWHQDNHYFKIAEPLLGVAMWIAAHDATTANGTLEVIPGVFGQPFEHTSDPLSDHHKRMWPTPEVEKKAVPLELRAGGVAFFCYGTPHCTRGNNTDRERAGIAFHFLHESIAAGSAYGPKLTAEDRAYHPYLTGPRATGGLREYGVPVAGTWREEVERTLREAEACGGPKTPGAVTA
jgi:hypothetical protein